MPETKARQPRPPAPAKVRILATADRLFYAEGVNTVGVDRLIAQSHVTKATFYKHYRSKDILITAFVDGRHAQAREALEADVLRLKDPVKVLQAFAASVVSDAQREGFRGCPFISALSGRLDPNGPVGPAVDEWRAWLRGALTDLFEQAGSSNAQEAADDLLLARDGAFGGAQVTEAAVAEASMTRALGRVLP